MKRALSLNVSIYREESQYTGELTADLCKASLEFLPIVLDKTGFRNGYEYRYASLQSIRRSTQAPLARHGLWLNHCYGHNDEGAYVITLLRHKSDQFMSSTLRIPQLPDMQEYKAWSTFLCGIAAGGLLSICTEEDSDGEGLVDTSVEPVSLPTSQQAANLEIALTKIKSAASVADLTRYQEIAQQRIEQGAFHPSAERAVNDAIAQRSAVIQQDKEQTNADGSGVDGVEGADASGSGSSTANRGGRRRAADAGRGDVVTRDAGAPVPA